MSDGITEDLSSAHREILDLLQRIEEEKRIDERTRLLYNLETSMIPHLIAEEKTAYSRLKTFEAGEARRQWEDSAVQHHVLRLMLRDLAETPPNEELFLAKVRMLRDFFKAHLALEEGEVFASLEELTGEERESLREAYRSERESAPCQAAGKGWLGGM